MSGTTEFSAIFATTSCWLRLWESVTVAKYIAGIGEYPT